MLKINTNNQIKLYKQYVVRNNELYKTKNFIDIEDNEIFCYIGTTPSTPPDIVFSLMKKNKVVEYEGLNESYELGLLDKENLIKYIKGEL